MLAAGAQTQDLRPTHCKRDDFLAHVFPIIETLRWRGRDAFDHVHQAVAAWIDKVAAPPLLGQVDLVPTN